MVVYNHDSVNQPTVECIQDVYNFFVYLLYIVGLFPYIVGLFRVLILPNYNGQARLACRYTYLSCSSLSMTRSLISETRGKIEEPRYRFTVLINGILTIRGKFSTSGRRRPASPLFIILAKIFFKPEVD